jgi:hypothetical protein
MSGSQLPAPSNLYGSAVDKLADTVRHVVDLVAGPERVRAKAQAQADAEVILARGQAEAQGIEARTIERIRRREISRQQNIEAIVVEATNALPSSDQVSGKPVEEDWTTRFFEESKDIGNKEMQILWARILAREVAQPGSFSPRTLTILRDLTKEDAALFTELCGLAWSIGDGGYVPFIDDVGADQFPNFAALTHLDTIGLVEFENLSGFQMRGRTEMHLQYFGQPTVLRSNTQRDLDVGCVLFTVAGNELCPINGAQAVEKHRVAMIERWRRQGWTVDSDVNGLAEPTQQLPAA